MSDFVLCGVLKEGNDFSPIYCDTSTGDMILDDDINGACIISNLGFPDPIEVVEEAAIKMAVDNGMDGVILTGTYLAFMKDGEATLRSYVEPDKVKMTIEYDTDIVYEGTIRYADVIS